MILKMPGKMTKIIGGMMTGVVTVMKSSVGLAPTGIKGEVDNMIMIGSFPTGTEAFGLIRHVINLGIDSRLKAIEFELLDVTDHFDDILHQKRYEFYLKTPKDLAVFLYRLDDLALQGDREAENLFRDIFTCNLGAYEDWEIYLSDDVHFIGCGNCDAKMESGDMELQDQVWYCHKCGWQGNFQTEWPWAYHGVTFLGRLDRYVEERLQAMSSIDDEE